MTVSAIRTADLRRMLGERRREVQDEVQQGVHDGRTNRPRAVRDGFEHADVDLQGDIDLEMLQMRAENLTRIDEALLRLDANQYGFCVECAGEIAARRLRVLPFAVRCRACEEKREHEPGRVRALAHQRGGSVSLFADASGA
jgi:DnaK suppressor protein